MVAHIHSEHPSLQAWTRTKGHSVFLGRAVVLCVKYLNSYCERDWNFALKVSPLVTYLLTPSLPLALLVNNYSMKSERGEPSLNQALVNLSLT